MKSSMLALAVAALLALPGAAQVPTGTMDTLRPDQKDFFALYKELVETDTTVTDGNCTQAAVYVGRDYLFDVVKALAE